MVPLCNSIIEKAKALFTSENYKAEAEPENKSILEELAYFPSLPKVRARGTFEADQHNNKVIKCTKQSSGHPSLLPGIFTLFCPHGEFNECMHGSYYEQLAIIFIGISYGFQVMRVHESPNVPFSVMYSRFPQGTV